MDVSVDGVQLANSPTRKGFKVVGVCLAGPAEQVGVCPSTTMSILIRGGVAARAMVTTRWAHSFCGRAGVDVPRMDCMGERNAPTARADEVGPMTWARHGEPMQGEEFGAKVVEAYGVSEAGGPLTLLRVLLPPLRTTQVEVEMSYCGLCHTDVSMVDNDWGISSYPLVPGHEGYGTVAKVGSEVTGLAPGDRVGIGWIRDSCGGCPACIDGRENLCSRGYQGTFLGPNAGPGVWCAGSLPPLRPVFRTHSPADSASCRPTPKISH